MWALLCSATIMPSVSTFRWTYFWGRGHKGNKPLCLRIHRQHRVVLYASDDAFIDFAVDNEKGWRELEVPPMTMLTIRHEDVRAIENSEFRFIPQERKGTLPEGV
ncbi:hypothetical protein [Marichromatium sp. PS1]|uniref:hypothetical protein n=1 Tax=Marichromatium sp. PS1 TaxID=3138932 RepID=UPI0034E8904F